MHYHVKLVPASFICVSCGRYNKQDEETILDRGIATAAATLAVAGKLLTRPRDADWDKNRDVVFHSEHSRFIDVDGVRVHYQEAGDSKRARARSDSRLCLVDAGLEQGISAFRRSRFSSDRARHAGLRLLRQSRSNGEYTIAGQAKLLTRLARSLSAFRERSLSAVRTAAQSQQLARSIIRNESRSWFWLER